MTAVNRQLHGAIIYEDRSINKLQNDIILLIFKIWKILI